MSPADRQSLLSERSRNVIKLAENAKHGAGFQRALELMFRELTGEMHRMRKFWLVRSP
jgi:hypothetical protein